MALIYYIKLRLHLPPTPYSPKTSFTAENTSPPVSTLQQYMKDNSRKNEYKVAQSVLVDPIGSVGTVSPQKYRTAKPYGRQSAQYKDALQRLKEIAEYEPESQHKPVAIFNPTTVLNKEEGMVTI